MARIGWPTLLGGTTHGPSVRWSNRERTLLLSGDHGEATPSAHQAKAFTQDEFSSLDSGRLPYAWQLDRHGPGHDHGWTFTGHATADGWAAEERLAGMLASWAEHMPVQAPGDWAGFKLWASRDWGRTMIVAFEPSETHREFHAAIQDRDHEQTPERAAEMRARGRQNVGEH
ncbi:hypothetical protein [Streptomyces hirsutus]|uniref:hypothetical protein n=1 Tax=Streptomyces hirsutus TaxID=35620 RepID=UPI0036C79415